MSCVCVQDPSAVVVKLFCAQTENLCNARLLLISAVELTLIT